MKKVISGFVMFLVFSGMMLFSKTDEIRYLCQLEAQARCWERYGSPVRPNNPYVIYDSKITKEGIYKFTYNLDKAGNKKPNPTFDPAKPTFSQESVVVYQNCISVETAPCANLKA